MIFIPWSTQLGHAKHNGLDPWKGYGLLGGDVLEDIAEEMCLLCLSPGALHLPVFVPVGLIK